VRTPRLVRWRFGPASLTGVAAIVLVTLLGVVAPSAASVSSSSPQSLQEHGPSVRPSEASVLLDARSPSAGVAQQVPLLAYFYIWFNPSSWNRLKIDYPLIGRYSSNDVSIMREQVKMAKEAGITGFLVSWKDTPVLNRRLASLRSVAAAEGFKLGIVIEGRDFYGDPMPMRKIRRSFAYLVKHFASDPVFDIFGDPLVAWSGTWLFSTRQLTSISSTYGSKLTILATEKQPSDYALIAKLFKGDAYYWSSADPRHTPGYASKLVEFSKEVHQHHGLWIAPAAPGFDSRLLGGVRDIRRRRGQTLRLELNAAITSSPDAVGLISWNEYSENSEIEPSQEYGGSALKVVAALEHAKAPVVHDFNSSDPQGFHAGPTQLMILCIFVLLLGGSVAIVLKRR
jgi:Glycosyl hydrolase family 99